MAGLIIGVLGLIITVFGIYFTVYFRKKAEITFFYGNEIPLFKQEIKGLEGLEIKYKGKEIQENLILFNGILCNTGNVDIERSIIHEPYKLVLPQEYEWKNVSLWDKNGCKATYSKNQNELVFTWDLMKRGECLVFNTIIEKIQHNGEDSLNTNLHKEISIKERITNLSTKREKIIRFSPSLFFNLFFSIFVILICIGVSYFLKQDILQIHKQTYMEFTDGSSSMLVRPILENEEKGLLTIDAVKYVDQNHLEIKRDNLEKLTYVKDVVQEDNGVRYLRWGFDIFVYSFAGWWIVTATYPSFKRRRKYKLLKAGLECLNKE